MSAFFVGEDHINALLSYVQQRDKDMQSRLYAGENTWTGIGKKLLAENVKSLAARYPEDYQEMGSDADVEAYKFNPDYGFLTRTPATRIAGAIMNMLSCYEYQSCEHDGWDKSEARACCERIRRIACRDVHGSEDSNTWPYNKPKNAPQVVSLTDLLTKH